MATRVVLIEPVSSGWRLIRAGHELGLYVIVASHDRDDRKVPAEHLAYADEVHVVDTNQDDQVARLVYDLHARHPLSAVLPGFEYYVPLAARLGWDLGLPSLDPRVALDLRLKHRMRQALARQGVPQPRFAWIRAEGEVAPALERVGLPCVVKPVDMAGSLLVRKALKPEEALEAVRRIQRRRLADLDRPVLGEALIEEYVEGPEYSVEGFVEAGRLRVVCITSKFLGPEPYFVEAGHIVPAGIAEADHGRVVAYVARVAAALGLTRGPFHAEVRCTRSGPLLIEIAARLGGDRIPDLVRLALGVDLYRIAYQSQLGLPAASIGRPGACASAGILFFLPGADRDWSRLLQIGPGDFNRRIRAIHMTSAGSPTTEARSFADRLGHVMVTGSSYDDTRGLLEELAILARR